MSVRTGDGLEWRVTKGAKRPGDLVLEVRTPAGWRNVKMETGFLMADFLAENEDVLRDEGYFTSTAVGGGYYLTHLRLAATEGWSVAAERLNGERLARRAREGQPVGSTVLATWCRASHPNESVVCTKEPGHPGPHWWNDQLVWPRETAAA